MRIAKADADLRTCGLSTRAPGTGLREIEEKLRELRQQNQGKDPRGGTPEAL